MAASTTGKSATLDNIFFARNSATQPAIKVIDWAQSKRGIGGHDLMHLLLSADSEERVVRDKRLLIHYYEGLVKAGIIHFLQELTTANA